MEKWIIDKFVEGKPVTFGNAQTEKPWKDLLKDQLRDLVHEPLEQANVMLDFFLMPTRFIRQGNQFRNDLDNLAKPVLDSMVELNIFVNDSYILDLSLRKRKSNTEGVRIRIANFSKNDSSFD